MKENTWELDDPFLYHLFDDAYLVDELGGGSAAAQAPATPSPVTLIVGSADFNQTDREFLSKVMKAVQTDLQECNIIAHNADTPTSLRSLKIPTGSRTILFGIQPEEFEALYTTTSFAGGSFFVADKISNIRSEESRKRLLWEALKTLFS